MKIANPCGDCVPATKNSRTNINMHQCKNIQSNTRFSKHKSDFKFSESHEHNRPNSFDELFSHLSNIKLDKDNDFNDFLFLTPMYLILGNWQAE